MWFKYYKGYYDVRKLELELVSRRPRVLFEFPFISRLAITLSTTRDFLLVTVSGNGDAAG
ncbi:hypothetical protein WN48_04546 [Eufriesea mexicana]|nr:hypothetical protein WN48_04546 [Eufriesea mexicana]